MGKKKDTVLPPKEFALVTHSEKGGLEFYVPNEESVPDGAEIEEAAIYLTACFIRYDDDAFRKEMIDWMEKRSSQ